ncbi:MAG: PAS domain-containing protein [Clostridia bacterium]|nr:PAS domain-containing protein [Clostridia bacterium]
MKKHSVLIQRALIFTAIVLTVAIAVGLLLNIYVSRSLDRRDRESEILRKAENLAHAAGEPASEWFQGALSVFERDSGLAWLVDATGAHQVTGRHMELTESLITEALASLGTGNVRHGAVRLGDAAYVYATVPVSNDDEDAVSALTCAIPLPGGLRSGAGAAIGAAVCLLAAALAAFLCLGRILVPVVSPIEELRDVAIGVASGNMNLRASEAAPGEAGALGKAFNEVTIRLSGIMYDRIVERNRLQQMIDGLSEGVLAVDRQGEITHTNPALEKMFASRRASASEWTDLRMRVVPDAKIWEAFDRVVRTGESASYTTNVRDMSVLVTITPIRDELDNIAGAAGLFADVTQMERLERTRREYVSNVSHELRTPLTAIQALVEPLRDGMVPSPEKRMRYYEIILSEVQRLARLVKDQLELSKLQSGTLAIEKSRIRLDDLIYDLCERYAPIARQKGLELRVPTDLAECPPVWSNADRIEEILVILLDNAIKYTEKGAVTVSAEWTEELVTLCVQDTGIGIEEADLEAVFDRFYKVDKSHSGKGSGLGLAIAKEILTYMGEEIRVDSEKGVGSAFRFTLHRREGSAA